MKNENDITEGVLSSLKHLKRHAPNPHLLDRITNQLDVETGRIIPLRQIKKLMVAASLLLVVNTVAIVNNINSENSSDNYVMEDDFSSIVSDYKIYK